MWPEKSRAVAAPFRRTRRGVLNGRTVSLTVVHAIAAVEHLGDQDRGAEGEGKDDRRPDQLGRRTAVGARFVHGPHAPCHA